MTPEEKRKKRSEYSKIWRQNNREKWLASINSSSARRRERIITSNNILSILEKNKIKEFYRKCPSGYHVDHIIPLSKGGSHTIENLQYLPADENRKKHAKWIGIEEGECYDPNFLLKRLENELKENTIILNVYTEKKKNGYWVKTKDEYPKCGSANYSEWVLCKINIQVFCTMRYVKKINKWQRYDYSWCEKPQCWFKIIDRIENKDETV